jgi:hypothetical protein
MKQRIKTLFAGGFLALALLDAHKELIKAVAYFLTSSATNVGESKDTPKRQREAVSKFAQRAGYDLVAGFSNDGPAAAQAEASS